ncbi:MAG: hypothetical protein MUC83_03785 [Pirellula sp.]|nr:hypothetical protein [Pirellula sp.]
MIMDDKQQELRQKLDATKAQLFEKLELLEDQISETIESTGTKVKSTVGAVESAIHSVKNAFNVQNHFKQHPWWCLAGALAVGYIAGGTRRSRIKKTSQRDSDVLGLASLDSSSNNDSQNLIDPSANLSALSAAYELGSRQSTANQARSLALNATVRVFEEILSRAIPLVMDRFTKKTDDISE